MAAGEVFSNYRVLVTAGAAGIGRATALAFLSAGARVHVCDIAAEALAVLNETHPQITTSHCDVGTPEGVDALFDDLISDFRGLDILVNNAGIAGPTAPVEEVSPEDWRRTIAVNLDAAYLCARRAVPLLKAEGCGAIVNISSTAGLYGYPMRTPYAAAKWAVIGLTKSLAAELGPFGVRCNAVCPGSVAGPRMDRVIAAEARATGQDQLAVRTAYERQCAMGSFIEPEEIADTVLYLSSPGAGKVNGEAISVDGYLNVF